MKTSSSPTSLDVARKAGVSRSIVSGVLNGAMSTMRVSPETRERILDAARELGYTPNPVARALRRQRSNVLGYVPRPHRITPYDTPVPFLLTVHLAQACLRHGYHIVEASTESTSRSHDDDLVQFLLGRHVDGVVLDSPGSAQDVAHLLDRRLPVVQMIRPQHDVITPSVMVDAVPGTTEAIEYFLEMGHRKIGFIGTSGQHPVDRLRLEAFERVLDEHGLPRRPEWVILEDAYSSHHGFAAATRLLEAGALPTALFVTGDNLAMGVLQLLYERNIRVPERLSVISYDDIFAGHLVPPLTSVSQPLSEAADQAIAMLAAEIDSPFEQRDSPPAVVLSSHLVRRASVRKLSTEEQTV